MKKLAAVFLAVSLLFSVCSAQESKTIIWNSIFGLSEGSTEEEISNAIQKTFSVNPSKTADHTFYPDQKYFYDIPVRWIIMTYNTMFGNLHSELEIAFEDDCLSAKNIEFIYNRLCDEFGEPTFGSITRETITINGKGEEEISNNDYKSIQQYIDQNNISGKICWDNIWIQFKSYVYNSKACFSFELHAAFSEASLLPEIRDIYGIKISR